MPLCQCNMEDCHNKQMEMEKRREEKTKNIAVHILTTSCSPSKFTWYKQLGAMPCIRVHWKQQAHNTSACPYNSKSWAVIAIPLCGEEKKRTKKGWKVCVEEEEKCFIDIPQHCSATCYTGHNHLRAYERQYGVDRRPTAAAAARSTIARNNC